MQDEIINSVVIDINKPAKRSWFVAARKYILFLVILGIGAGSVWFTSPYFIANIKRVDLKLTKDSSFTLSDDNYVNSITNEDSSLSNIISNGHNIYYNSDDIANSWLGGKTVKFSDGGELIPCGNWSFYFKLIYSKIIS